MGEFFSTEITSRLCRSANRAVPVPRYISLSSPRISSSFSPHLRAPKAEMKTLSSTRRLKMNYDCDLIRGFWLTLHTAETARDRADIFGHKRNFFPCVNCRFSDIPLRPRTANLCDKWNYPITRRISDLRREWGLQAPAKYEREKLVSKPAYMAAFGACDREKFFFSLARRAARLMSTSALPHFTWFFLTFSLRNSFGCFSNSMWQSINEAISQSIARTAKVSRGAERERFSILIFRASSG